MIQLGIKLSMFILSWLSVFLLPNKKQVFIKYLPVTLFSSMTLLGEIFFFTTYKLWSVKGKQKEMMHMALLLVFGPYLVLNIWSFYLSKGKFLSYALINVVADFIYAFPVISFFKKINLFKIKVKSHYFFLLVFCDSLLNYVFHKTFEKIYKPNNI
ncbi:hypothetical protein J2Z40_000064 [Cytobacillus eiseniae]|uniref:Uncharacterized protein n=1 Tax=Cytobacillus eiseniae TaxID=762947 RepID=A0ABS4R9F1_9BACI|nr:hypothetical protein [Cytobacillus eiseniae]